MQELQEERLFHCFQRMMGSVEGRQSAAASRGELFLLSYIYQQSDPVLPGTLSDLMCVSAARISRLLRTLEERGLVVRSASPHDHRRVEVRLSEAGKAYVEGFQRQVRQRISAIVKALGEEDTQTFLRIAERILAISHALSAQEKRRET